MSDPIATAQDFHRREPRPRFWLFSVSRERKARLLDSAAVALLMALMVAFGAILFAASAKADPDSDVYAYSAEYGGAVCSVLDDYPSVGGMLGVGQAIVEHGHLTEYQAGEVIALSVTEICPRHMGLLARFVRVYGTAAA